jgi:hypothetical protein
MVPKPPGEEQKVSLLLLTKFINIRVNENFRRAAARIVYQSILDNTVGKA